MSLYEQLEALKLGKVYAYVMENNSANNLPYHNNFHIESVTKYALMGAKANDLDKETQKNLAIAALFHDFNHTGSGKDDDKNIEIAIRGFKKFYDEIGNETITEFDRDLIIDLIKPTRFPYLVECGVLSLSQKIIRDADILQGLFAENYINGVVFGIAAEAKIPMDKMLAGQEAFLKGTKFCTEWAKKLSEARLPAVLKQVNLVKEFFSKKD